MPGNIHSKKQARYFGAVAGGAARKGSSLTPSQAKESLRGVDTKKLPSQARPPKKK